MAMMEEQVSKLDSVPFLSGYQLILEEAVQLVLPDSLRPRSQQVLQMTASLPHNSGFEMQLCKINQYLCFIMIYNLLWINQSILGAYVKSASLSCILDCERGILLKMAFCMFPKVGSRFPAPSKLISWCNKKLTDLRTSELHVDTTGNTAHMKGSYDLL